MISSPGMRSIQGVGMDLPVATPHPPDNNTDSANKTCDLDGPRLAMSGPSMEVGREGEGQDFRGRGCVASRQLLMELCGCSWDPIFFQVLAFDLFFMHLSKHCQDTPHLQQV